jgi:hypothetical protein
MITIIIDKNTILRQTTPATFGMNLYAGANPKNFVNPKYKANIEYMNSGFLRYHNGGSVRDSAMWEGLMNHKTQTWDVAKLRKMLGVKFAQKPKLLFNISSWPVWMEKDGFLSVQQHDNYAKLMADLVKIVNKDLKMGVQWWEPMNEWDMRYFTDFYDKGGWGELKEKNNPDRWDEVISVFNKCAVAMKKVDPTIKVGGPAAARPDLSMMHERFIKGTATNLDFFSYHAYASGDAKDSDEAVYNNAAGMGNSVGKVVDLIKKHLPRRPIPVFLDEYNVSWTWETRDVRMTNQKSAVFDALVAISTIRAGVAALFPWNEQDGIYGKTDSTDTRRPGADFQMLCAKYLVGDVVSVKSDDEKQVMAMAVRQKATQKVNLLLVNRTNMPRDIGGPFPKTVKAVQVAEKGMRFVSSADTLPPHSVTIVSL